MYVFLDYPGNLEFNFSENSKSSEFFFVGALMIRDEKHLRRIIKFYGPLGAPPPDGADPPPEYEPPLGAPPLGAEYPPPPDGAEPPL